MIAKGAALRAEGRDEEAFVRLREAIEIAELAGAGSIGERARRELNATRRTRNTTVSEPVEPAGGSPPALAG